MSGTNLDQLCAKYGWQIADEVRQAIGKNAENHITKSLGVLQEDGVYAFFLYQASRGSREKPGADKLTEQASAFLREAGIAAFQNNTDSLQAVRDHLAGDLDQLLLAKRLLEQALIYARYHAKALG
jgi:ubiquinone biosynthesis protein UbiJ